MPRPASVVLTFTPNSAKAATKAMISRTMRFDALHQDENRLSTSARGSSAVYHMFEAPVRNSAHQPCQACHQQRWQKTKVILAIYQWQLKQVHEYAVNHDGKDA